MGSACVCAQGSPTSHLASPGGTLRTVPPVLPALARCDPLWPIGLLGGGLSVLAYGLVPRPAAC